MGTTVTPKDLALVQALVQDRWDQLTVQPIVSTRDSGSEIEVSPLWQRIEADLQEVAARAAGGEVVAFGMRELVDGLQDIIRDEIIAWAIAYTMGERSADALEAAGGA